MDDMDTVPTFAPPGLPRGRRVRGATTFEQSLDTVGPRGFACGYLAAGVFLAWWQGMPADSVLTWLTVLVWPLALLLELGSLMFQGALLAAGTIVTLVAVPYVLGRALMGWKESEARRRFVRVVEAVRGHA